MLNIKQKLSRHLYVVAILVAFSCTSESEIASEIENQKSYELSTDYTTKSSREASSSTGHYYRDNLKNVIGDVKQAQITNKFNTTSKIDNALDGFEEMGVNGIRIAIFTAGLNPNESMYKYLFDEAKARGFKIFSNPAQGGGGARIASGILNGTVSSVKNTEAANTPINRIKEFSQEYGCDWINCFNEDGRPGSVWYIG